MNRFAATLLLLCSCTAMDVQTHQVSNRSFAASRKIHNQIWNGPIRGEATIFRASDSDLWQKYTGKFTQKDRTIHRFQQHFLAVHISVRNRGKDQVTIRPEHFFLKTNRGEQKALSAAELPQFIEGFGWEDGLIASFKITKIIATTAIVLTAVAACARNGDCVPAAAMTSSLTAGISSDLNDLYGLFTADMILKYENQLFDKEVILAPSDSYEGLLLFENAQGDHPIVRMLPL